MWFSRLERFWSRSGNTLPQSPKFCGFWPENCSDPSKSTKMNAFYRNLRPGSNQNHAQKYRIPSVPWRTASVWALCPFPVAWQLSVSRAHLHFEFPAARRGNSECISTAKITNAELLYLLSNNSQRERSSWPAPSARTSASWRRGWAWSRWAVGPDPPPGTTRRWKHPPRRARRACIKHHTYSIYHVYRIL